MCSQAGAAIRLSAYSSWLRETVKELDSDFVSLDADVVEVDENERKVGGGVCGRLADERDQCRFADAMIVRWLPFGQPACWLKNQQRDCVTH